MATTQQSYAPAAKKMKLDHEGTNGSVPSPVGTPIQTQPTSSPASTTPAPAPAQAATQPAYTTTAQWSTQIPIDPALQQQPTAPAQHPMMSYQHYTYGTTHYPTAAYSHSHFQQYQAAQSTPTASTAATAPAPLSRQPTQTTLTAATTTAATQPTQPDSTNVATLNDALGSAGVDLRAEEETLQRSQDHHTTYRSYEDRSRKQPITPSFDTRILGTTMRDVGSRHKIARIPEDSVNYVALALRTRLQDLITAMAAAAEHRVRAQYDKAPGLYEDGTPMWSVVVRKDIKRQLEVLEKIEREEEQRLRRERKERAEAAAEAAAAATTQGSGTPGPDGAGAGEGDAMAVDMGTPVPKKPKKKKDGPGVTAKNMSEDVQKRLSNAVATQAAGLGRRQYAWMNAGGVTAATPVKKEKSVTPAVGTSGAASTTAPTTQTTTTTTQAANGSSWSKPYMTTAQKASASPAPQDDEKTTVTMRDAMFVIERERGHGAGCGAASRAWV